MTAHCGPTEDDELGLCSRLIGRYSIQVLAPVGSTITQNDAGDNEVELVRSVMDDLVTIGVRVIWDDDIIVADPGST